MATFTRSSSSWPNVGTNIQLRVTVTTSYAIDGGGTQLNVVANAVSSSTNGFFSYGDNGIRTYNVPGGRTSGTNGSLLESGSATWVYSFSSNGLADGTALKNHTVLVWGGFNRFIPFGPSSVNVTITADGNSSSNSLEEVSVTVPVTLLQPQDDPPAFVSGSFQDGTVGQSYYDTRLVSNTNSVNITGLPPGLGYNFSSSSQTITVSGTPTTANLYTANITLTGDGGTENTSDNINVSAPSISFSGSFDNAQQGVYYSDYITISNADSAYASGLGSGLSGSFNPSNGRFTVFGTPSNDGSDSFIIYASNNQGGSNNRSYSIYVAAPSNPSWIDRNLDDFFVGISYLDSVSANNTESYSISGQLPPGLTFNNGTISGTPEQELSVTEMTEYEFTITANGVSGTTPVQETFIIPLRFPGRLFTNSSGGSANPVIARRLNDSNQWEPIQRARRWNGSSWVDVTIL